LIHDLKVSNDNHIYCQNSSADVINVSVEFAEIACTEEFCLPFMTSVDKGDVMENIIDVTESFNNGIASSDWLSAFEIPSPRVSLHNFVFQLLVQSVQGSGSWKAFIRKSMIQHLNTVVPIIHRKNAATTVIPIPFDKYKNKIRWYEL
jgi:hypothetical protein